jgi:hypothetical protein
MSDIPETDEAHETETEKGPESGDDQALSNLLKRSLAATTEAHAPPSEAILLRNVQKKIRKRSRGRFFADGWSTSAQRVSYVTIALVMLLVLAVAFFALGPTSIR